MSWTVLAQLPNAARLESRCYATLRQLTSLGSLHHSRALLVRHANRCQASAQHRAWHTGSVLLCPQATTYFKAAPSEAPASHRFQTIHAAVAANLPVFVFHPAERYFPCTVEWFLERCELHLIRRGWKRQLLRGECCRALPANPSSQHCAAVQCSSRQGEVNGPSLEAAQRQFEQEPTKKRKLMQLVLNPAARSGQADAFNQVPIYAHVKDIIDPQGNLEAIEVNYMTFLAYNGSYKLFGLIYIGEVGAHDGDWEHVTLRLSPDASQVFGIYYSAHRHRDGKWFSADEMPRTADGRPLSYIAINGHGSYPRAGFIPRIFLAFNDRTGKGQVWDSKKCVLVTQKDIPQVTSRGNELNGSSYPSGHVTGKGVQVQLENGPAPWLSYEGKWGSTVEAPALQEWFARAENPVSRSWLAQIFFPLAPGIESIWEPFQEQVEERYDEVQHQIDEAMGDTREMADQFKQEIRELQEQIEATSGDVRTYLQGKLNRLLRQKDRR